MTPYFLDPVFPWPNWRYLTGPNPRDSHAALDGFVAKKTDPIWSRIFPPWGFRCNCSVEDCDDDEAKEFGGVKASVNGKIDNNGFIDLSGPSPDGFSFNPAEAFSLIDPSRIKDPGLRLEAIEQTEIAFGDVVQRQPDGALKVVPTKQKYATWEENNLKSAKTWSALSVPDEIAPEKALAMLKKGIELIAGDGGTVVLGKEVLKHWAIDKQASEKEITSRLKKLNAAIATVESPHEVWRQETQKRYLQIFNKEGGGYEGCLVAVTNDGKARTYFIRSVKGVDNSRNGISYEAF